MQTTIKKSDTRTKRDKPPKDEVPKPQDEKIKKTYNVSTPRNFIQKSSTADIYGQKKRVSTPSAKAPKKSITNTNINNPSPMKGLLKSTPLSISVASSVKSIDKNKVTRKEIDSKTHHTATKVKDFSIAINSPVAKKRLNLNKEKSFIKEVPNKKISSNLDKEKSFIKEVPNKKTSSTLNKEKSFNKEGSNKKSSLKDESQKMAVKIEDERQRTKTRTLNENEVKILTSDAVDNNAQMLNLSRKLKATPKAFFVDLNENKAIQIEKQPRSKTPSDEEISYEDDFESYESDFDSYHSSSPSVQVGSDGDDGLAEAELKETKDEEKMLDSGSFDLRDQRSATKNKPPLDFILETAEDKPSSLTDEGFQEMSSSSAVSIIRTAHVDVLDRPHFMDFTKSKENKRKKRINERLKQRAKDLLSIITLHEMSYSLFEMQPISYDLYMATFGRTNYQQVAVQTFDDGITEEVQTEDIEYEHKWTQHPVDFSNSDICINNDLDKNKFIHNKEDYLTKFTFLTQTSNIQNNNVILNEEYKSNPLRIFFEQKDGVGPNEILPYETYKTKLKNNEYNTQRLGKFLKKMETKVCNMLNTNSGNTELTQLKITKLPFSKGYVSISTKSLSNEKISFLSNTKISQVYFSETKPNLIITVHNKTQNINVSKCTLCLWDINVARQEPVKILTAIDNVAIGSFRGATDGIFVGALVDGSIHLWDLSERPMWRPNVTSDEKCDKLVEVNEKDLTFSERDREWNLRNSQGLDEINLDYPLQACAFTNSACNINNMEIVNTVVGLEFTGDMTSREGRRVVGQIVALQRTGVLTIWLIIQEKSKTVPPDIGKAFWSKMKLEKSQTISLLDHIATSTTDSFNNDFNLNVAKRRLQNKKQERNILKISRPKSAIDIDTIDRPSSVASLKNKKVLPVHKDVSENWENGVVCYDLKVVFWKNSDNYLIAKNCGEVLCCRRTLGAVRVSRFCVATDASSVTCVEASPHNLPYYLAATDAGTISVCSLLENRVLITLDCRNIPTQDMEKYTSDHKGRFISATSSKMLASTDMQDNKKLLVSSLSWSRINPCCIFACLDGTLVSWTLSHSDIYAKSANDAAAITCVAGDSTLALLTPDGEVHVHKLTNEHKTKEYLTLFEKYVALL